MRGDDLLLPGNHLGTFSVTYPLLRLNVLHRRMPLFHLVLFVSLVPISIIALIPTTLVPILWGHVVYSSIR